MTIQFLALFLEDLNLLITPSGLTMGISSDFWFFVRAFSDQSPSFLQSFMENMVEFFAYSDT